MQIQGLKPCTTLYQSHLYKNNPVLYDKKNPRYTNASDKVKAWTEIGTNLGLTGQCDYACLGSMRLRL